MREAEAAGLGPFECLQAIAVLHDARDGLDTCGTKLPRVRFDLDRLGGPVTGAGLRARRITAILWSADP